MMIPAHQWKPHPQDEGSTNYYRGVVKTLSSHPLYISNGLWGTFCQQTHFIFVHTNDIIYLMKNDDGRMISGCLRRHCCAFEINK